ncbi:hypothetical protein [Pseudomonas sp. Marseille-QA0332]
MLAKPASPTYRDGHHPLVNQAGMERYYAEVIELLGARTATGQDEVPNRIGVTDYDGELFNAGLFSSMLGFLLRRRPAAPTQITDSHGVERWESDYRNDSFWGRPQVPRLCRISRLSGRRSNMA